MKTRIELDDPVFCRTVEEDYLKNKIGIKALAKKYGMSGTSIRKILIARNVPMKRAGVNLTPRKKVLAPAKAAAQTQPVKSKTVYNEGAAFSVPMSRLMAGR